MSNNKEGDNVDISLAKKQLIKAIDNNWPSTDIEYETIAKAENGPVLTDESLARIGHALQGEVGQTVDSDLLSTWVVDKGSFRVSLTSYKPTTPYTVTGEAGVTIFQTMDQTSRNPLYPVYAMGGISEIEIPKTLDPNFVRFTLHSTDVTAWLSVHRNGTISQSVDQKPLRR